MDVRKSTRRERIFVAVLFILVWITFSLAERDSKRMQYQYTLTHAPKTNVAVGQKPAPFSIPAH